MVGRSGNNCSRRKENSEDLRQPMSNRRQQHDGRKDGHTRTRRELERETYRGIARERDRERESLYRLSFVALVLIVVASYQLTS